MKTMNRAAKKAVFALLGILTSGAAMSAAELLPYPIDTIEGQAVYRYEVEKSIGLYRISVNFGVSQADIIRMNPALEERGLHYGETILIPVVDSPADDDTNRNTVEKPHVTSTEQLAVSPTTGETTSLIVPDTASISLGTVLADTILPTDNDTTRIALLLPFQACNTKRDHNTDRFIDFYEGVLLALYDMQAPGTHYVLDVYDTEKSDARVRDLIDNNSLHEVDAIIGLAYPLQLMQMGEWSKQHQIPLLAPFVDHIEGIESNPYMLQFNSSYQQEATAMADWLDAHRGEINCVLIDAKDADIPPVIRQLRKEIKGRNIPYTTTSIHNILNDSISSALRDSMENILIFNTTKYSNIQVLIPRIISSKGEHTVTLYSQYSWRKEHVALPEVYTSIFDTDSIRDTNEYEVHYAAYFNHPHATDVPRYDLLGYDLTRQLIAFLKGSDYHGLQSEIRFERISPDGGYVNTHIRIQRTQP